MSTRFASTHQPIASSMPARPAHAINSAMPRSVPPEKTPAPHTIFFFSTEIVHKNTKSDSPYLLFLVNRPDRRSMQCLA